MTLPPESERLVEQVAAEFVHHLFPSFRMPGFLACPNDICAQAVLAAITRAAGAKEVATEVIDLRPAPAELLDSVTQRLCGFQSRRERNHTPTVRVLALDTPTVRVLALDGFDLLEGPDHDAPTYPFRSEFQFSAGAAPMSADVRSQPSNSHPIWT